MKSPAYPAPRVLHVIGGDDTGGAMSHLLPLLLALREAGCQAELLCLGEGGLAAEARARGITVFVLPMRGAHDLGVLGPLGRVLSRAGLRDGAWQIVHTHGMRAHIPTRLVLAGKTAWKKGRLRQAKGPYLVATVHSDLRLDYPLATARFYELLDRTTLGAVDLIVCVSEALRDLLVARGYPAERMVVIRSGLEAQRLASLAHLAQARVTGEGRPLRVGTVARLVKAKRLELFLQTMAEIRRAGSVSSGELEVEALVAGDGPERAALERLARDLGLEQVVRFLGRVSQVEEVLREIDVYLVTSVFEGGVSLAVLEAMAAGLPVVATRAGGVAEAVIDGQTGFLVEEQAFGGPGSNGRPSIGRPNIGRGRIGQRHTGRVRSRQGHSGRRANLALAAALADRVQTLLRDSELRLRMGQAGAQRVQEHFVAARAAAETLQAYQRLLTL